MSISNNHHYVPAFYLKRWSNKNDKKLIEFSRPMGRVVKPQRKHPNATGYEKKLYKYKIEGELATPCIEETWFKPMDDLASKALDLIEMSNGNIQIDPGMRTAWAKFIRSLGMRTPDDIAALKRNYEDAWRSLVPEDEMVYAEIRKAGDPQSAREYVDATNPAIIENSALDLIPRLNSDEPIIKLICNFHWFVLDVKASDHELLTSDKPIMRTALDIEKAYIMLPIGPRKAFWAVNSRHFAEEIQSRVRRDWVERINRHVLEQATKYAFGRTDAPLRFVDRYLSIESTPSIFDAMGQ
jgi:hypothetical protein